MLRTPSPQLGVLLRGKTHRHNLLCASLWPSGSWRLGGNEVPDHTQPPLPQPAEATLTESGDADPLRVAAQQPGQHRVPVLGRQRPDCLHE